LHTLSDHCIRLICGLGNPGPEHEADRHNAGYWFIDRLIHSHGGMLKPEAKFSGELGRTSIDGHDVRLLQPTAYMNRSGQSVQAVLSYFNIAPDELLVVHDELDLPPGTVRLKRGGGHGGHNGMRDIISHIGREFFRLRIGIGHPGSRNDVTDYVLKRPSRDDRDRIEASIAEAVDVLPLFLGQGDQKAMHKLHSKKEDAD